jgi:hypothetical protein
MLQWLKNTWIGSPPLEFESSFDLEESVERLRAVTRRSSFSDMARETAVGTVKERRVSLKRAIPMVGNSFKPFFVGRFEEADGKIVLRGHFTMHWFAKIFMTVWLGIIILVAIVLVTQGIRSPKAWEGLPVVIAMIGAGLGLIKFGQWLSRNDPAWLAQIIRDALRTPGASTMPEKSDWSRRFGLPGHLLGVVIFIAVGGVLSLVSGIIGRQSSSFIPLGPIIANGIDGSTLRYLTAIYGSLMLAWAYGLYRRNIIAWWVGFGFFGYWGLGIIESVAYPKSAAQMALSSHFSGMTVFIVMGALVLGVWMRWWYAQRVHFRD